MAEAILAMPSIAPMIATNTCRSYRPLNPSDIRTIKSEIPIAAHVAPRALPSVVGGWPFFIREIATPVAMPAAIMVTGHAR